MRYRTRVFLMAALLPAVTIPLMLGCGPPPRTPAADIRRVVVVHFDATRRDDFGCYGGITDTPNVDTLASKGMRYTNAITCAPGTSPSIATFMTGRYPRHHGVYKPGHALSRDCLTLAEIFAQYGFATGGFTSNGIVTSSHVPEGDAGFDQGFDVFRCVGDIVRKVAGPPKSVEEAMSADLTREAIAFVREHRDRPFFLWMLHLDPHYPYNPPPPYDTMYRDYPSLLAESVRLTAYPWGPTGVDTHEIIAKHLGEVAVTDYWVGALMKEFEDLAGKTLVIITADHGESMGDADYWFQHGQNIRYPCINVPFIVACEGAVPAGTSNALVGNADIAPTILDLLGIPADVMDVDGRSLVPTFAETDPWPDRMIPVATSAVSDDGSTQRGVRSKYHSLQCRYDDATGDFLGLALYDHRTDPREEHDISRDQQDLVREHVRFLQDWLASPTAETSSLRNDPEMIDRLKTLGYLN